MDVSGRMRMMWDLRRAMRDPVPGLVRMDRAVLYLKQQLKEHIEELSRRQTKTLGDYYYRLHTFNREVLPLIAKGGDSVLAEQFVNGLTDLGARSSRQAALERLRSLQDVLDKYEPLTATDDPEELKLRLASLEEQLSFQEQ